MIDTVAKLEDVIGRTPPAMHAKVIDHLDAGALRWISQSPLIFAGFGFDAGIRITLAGGTPGFVDADAHALSLPLADLDDPVLAQRGSAFASLVLLPGIGETLRINGRVADVDGDRVRVKVEECYGHCAKAFIRSRLWDAAPIDPERDLDAFVAASRFMALATISATGHADLSPKGDPTGCLAQLEGDTLWFADRPGNRRADSFRNIIERPAVSLALLVPGTPQIAVVHGRAHLTAEPARLKLFEVQNKTPLLAVGVSIASIALRDSAALAHARLWPVETAVNIDPAKLFIDHVRLNKTGGITGSMARASLALPGMTRLMKKGLERDYKTKLY